MKIDWKRRPDVPGLYLCVGTARLRGAMNGMRLTQEDIDVGRPFFTSWVYGPIPEPPADATATAVDSKD
jgi:hypothetical protein